MSTGDPSPITPDGYFMNDAGLYVPVLPADVELNITSAPVTAQARAMKSNWTPSAIDDLKMMMGVGGPEYPDNALDKLNDALEDPNYDPNDPSYMGLPRWPDGRVATREEYLKYNPNEKLVSDMAAEMTREIDNEILQTLRAQAPVSRPRKKRR